MALGLCFRSSVETPPGMRPRKRRWALTSRKYPDPPVIEAVCEFLFDSDTPWDPTFPDLLYDNVRTDFPKRRQVPVFEAVFESEPRGVQQRLIRTERWQFLTENEDVLVQLGPDLLALNHLRPYPGWETFLPIIRTVLQSYKDIANPARLYRATLNYINRIDIPGENVELSNYLNFYPFVSTELPLDRLNFLASVQFAMESGRDILQIRASSIPANDPGMTSVLLDLNYFLGRPGSTTPENALTWLEQAHIQIGTVFEACVKDSLRQQFEGAK